MRAESKEFRRLSCHLEVRHYVVKGIYTIEDTVFFTC